MIKTFFFIVLRKIEIKLLLMFTKNFIVTYKNVENKIVGLNPKPNKTNMLTISKKKLKLKLTISKHSDPRLSLGNVSSWIVPLGSETKHHIFILIVWMGLFLFLVKLVEFLSSFHLGGWWFRVWENVRYVWFSLRSSEERKDFA